MDGQDQRVWVRAALVLLAGAVIAAASLGARQMPSLPLAIAMLLPLLAGTLVGLLFGLDKVERQRNLPDLQRLRGLAEQGRRLAIYDRETGFYAQWYVRLRLEEEVGRSDRYQRTFALLLIEAGRGRLGSDVEQQLFSDLRRAFRATDLVAHLGSLRFVALLPNTAGGEAEALARRIRATLTAGEVHLGIACYPVDGPDWSSLLDAAQSLAKAA